MLSFAVGQNFYKSKPGKSQVTNAQENEEKETRVLKNYALHGGPKADQSTRCTEVHAS